MNMRHHGLTGSHSSPRSQGARASDRRALSRGTHEAGTLGLQATHLLMLSKTPNILGGPGRNQTSAIQQAGWPPTREPGLI